MAKEVERIDLTELHERNPKAYDAFVQHLIDECSDDFILLDDGRIMNADSQYGDVLVYEDSEWKETHEELDEDDDD